MKLGCARSRKYEKTREEWEQEKAKTASSSSLKESVSTKGAALCSSTLAKENNISTNNDPPPLYEKNSYKAPSIMV
jgi:hypothetical protein